MINPTVQNALNEQINNELYSAYLYLSMVAYCEGMNLSGFAHWFRVQSQEEVSHAMRFFEYVHDRGGRVMLEAIEKPPVEFESPLDIIKQSYEHEQRVTGMIERLYSLALKENDYPTQVLLQWFINEQVEEEKNAAFILERLRMIGENRMGLILLDRQLGKRGPAGEE